MKQTLLVLFALAALLPAALVPAARAQSGRRVALGVGFSAHSYADDELNQKSPGFGLVDRISLRGRAREGWSVQPKVSVDLLHTDVHDEFGGSAAPRVGQLRQIPVLVGAGPVYRRGRVSVSPGLLVGASFNKYTPATGTPAAHVGNAFVVRPETGVWYDVSSTLGLRAAVSYAVSRVTVDPPVTGPLTSGNHWRMDHLNVSAGFAIGVL